MGLWGALMEAIPAYTGLSPVAFFTVLALLAGIYHLLIGLIGSSGSASNREAVAMEPLPEPVQLGEITEEQLKAYDGSDSSKPLLMAIKGQIYDVTRSGMFYGPGGPYHLFAGKDASRALAKMSFEEQDLNSNLEGLGTFELDALQDWEFKFQYKYPKVGTVRKSADKETETAGDEPSNVPDSVKESTDREAAVGAVKVNDASDDLNHEKAKATDEQIEKEPKTNGPKEGDQGHQQTTATVD